MKFRMAMLMTIVFLAILPQIVSAATGTYTLASDLDAYAFPDLTGSTTTIPTGDSINVLLEMYEPISGEWLAWIELSAGARMWTTSTDLEAASSYVAPTVPPAAVPAPVGGTNEPVESWCRLGTTIDDTAVPQQNLVWDPAQERGYMSNGLETLIQSGPAYCYTQFPHEVDILFDSVATLNPGGYVEVDGNRVSGGNGRLVTGTEFIWVYPSSAISNGHAFIVQP